MKDFIIISEPIFEKARKKINEIKDKKIIFSSNDDELNRKILEKEKIDVLLLTQSGRKDFQKQRNSGFNQVLGKIAKKNDVKIGINLDEIVDSYQRVYNLKGCENLQAGTKEVREPLRGPEKFFAKTFTKGKNKSDILARVRQNIKLCNKNKLKMSFVSFGKFKKNIYDLKSLGLVLGMPTWMVKEQTFFN